MTTVYLVMLALAVTACAKAGSSETSPNDGDSARTTPVSAAIPLSNDTQPDPFGRGCLANDLGVVPRFTDNESYAASDPRNPDRVIAVWQTQSGAGSVIQWVRSTDGGATWTPPRPAPINACAGGPLATGSNASDPWVSLGPDGRVYISAITWKPNPNDGPDLVNALVVVSSPDGGLTWENPVAAAIAPSTEIAHDNLAVTADPTRPGTVYAATTRAESKPNDIYFGRLGFTRSDDGGKTWIPIRSITEAINGERIGAPQIVVDPRSGRLYAVYHRSRRGSSSVIGVMISNDKGETWSAEHVAAPYVRSPQPNHPVTGRPFVLATDIVQATVSPTTGHVVIAYADARRDPGRRTDVSLVWSTDGTRWSQPIAVSDATQELAWLPAIASNPNGDVAVSYFSARFDAGQSTARTRLMVRRFMLSSSGLTAGERVVLDSARLEWPGDYQGLVAVRRGFLATYGRETDIAAAISPGAAR
jgi:hypothetical protein